MAILLIIFVVMLSVAAFFFMAVKFGSSKDSVSKILDGDAISRSSREEPESLVLDPDRVLKKEADPLLLDDDDQYV